MVDKVSILLVDDNPENLFALEAVLGDLGQNLVLAHSGTEALRLLLKQEFALILLDVDMPNINGFETAELLRQRDKCRHIPIIFLTAVNKSDQHVFRGYSVGAIDYLTKPFVPEILRSKVTAFVDLYKKGEEVKRQARLLQRMVQELGERNASITALNSELQAERDFVTTILDGAETVVLVLDNRNHIIRANSAIEKILHYLPSELPGRTLDSLFANPQEWNPGYTRSESYWIAKDGRIRLFAWSQTRLSGKHGKPDHMIVTANDVTERKQAEEQREQIIRAEASRAEAEAAERRAAFLAEASNMLASTLDYEKTLVNISRLAIPDFADWCLVFLLKDDGIGSPLVAHREPEKENLARQLKIEPADPHSCVLPVMRVLQSGTPELLPDITSETLRQLVRDDPSFQILNEVGCRSAVIVPIARLQSVSGIIGFISNTPCRYGATDLHLAVDLAQRISLALENARLYSEAQQASRAKDEFLATLSHELRTPLNAILGWTQILRKKKLDEVTSMRAFEAIERNAKAQAQLVEDMLDVSRIITGRLRLDFQLVALAAAVEAALEAVRPAAEAKGVRLSYDPPGETAVISGDLQRLQQIVWNLLSNGVKFTPAGGVVRVLTKYVGAEARLEVSDTGKGISPEFLPMIFDRFRQADTSMSRTYGGLGLGLSIARHLVELHGGTIEGASEGEGKGAAFTVSFPIREIVPIAAASNAQ